MTNDKKEYSLDLSQKEMQLNESGIPSVNQVSPTCHTQVKLSQVKSTKDKLSSFSTNLGSKGVWGEEGDKKETSADAPTPKKRKRFKKRGHKRAKKGTERGYK